MLPQNKVLSIDFSDFRGGLNTKDPHLSIGENQAYYGTQNVIFKKIGLAPWPAFVGLGGNAVITGANGKMKGMDIYSRVDGTDSLIIANNNGDIYSVNKSTSALTYIYSLGPGGKVWFVSMYDKLFATNGTSSCVIQGPYGYTIGITPPSGVVASASTGGTLPDGDYIIYASYAITVGGLDVLYSQGQYLGTISLSSGNNTISITNFANSTDSRVGNKIIWASDANGADIVLYRSLGNNLVTYFDISDDSGRDPTKYYRVLANPSAQPPLMTGIFSHDDRIFGWRNNVLYASMQAVTVYDLERWPGIQYEFPYYISGLFAIGEDLFINTINNGIIKLPYGDMSAKFNHVSRKMCFKYISTVCNTDENTETNPSPVIGLTGNGVRVFNGKNFTIDISKSIKNDIKDLYDGASDDHQPTGLVCRSNDRTEYRLSYRDLDIGSINNNYSYVLNLDELVIKNSTDYIAPWELITIGFDYSCIDSDETVFMAQSLSDKSQIFKLDENSTYDYNIINKDGNLITRTSKPCNLVTKMVIPNIAGRFRLEQLRYISYMRSVGTVTIYIGENKNVNEQSGIQASLDNPPLFGVARFGIDRFADNDPVIALHKLGENLKGVTVYLVFTFNSISVRDYISAIQLFGEYGEGRMK